MTSSGTRSFYNKQVHWLCFIKKTEMKIRAKKRNNLHLAFIKIMTLALINPFVSPQRKFQLLNQRFWLRVCRGQ